jgi:hypothetical protein
VAGVKSAQEYDMHYDEVDAGDYRLRIGAVEAPEHGYLASLVISMVQGFGEPREVYRDDDMAGGYAWPSPQEALQYAMTAGQRLLRDPHLAMRG